MRSILISFSLWANEQNSPYSHSVALSKYDVQNFSLYLSFRYNCSTRLCENLQFSPDGHCCFFPYTELPAGCEDRALGNRTLRCASGRAGSGSRGTSCGCAIITFAYVFVEMAFSCLEQSQVERLHDHIGLIFTDWNGVHAGVCHVDAHVLIQVRVRLLGDSTTPLAHCPTKVIL